MSNFLKYAAIPEGKEQKFIPLSDGYVALVDPEDFERFGKFNWRLQDSKAKFLYARRIAQKNNQKTTIYLHRAIMDAPKGVLVDHANRNTLDCRRANLRLATSSQNLSNCIRRRGKHGFIGVKQQYQKFYGRVKVNGREYTTPAVTTPEQAARDRDQLAMRLHGEFAVLNFPKEVAHA
jgi:hypothetical protein